MNEFTKEELEFFVQSMGYHKWHHNGPLITKVQSMIENYCEHSIRINYGMAQGVNVECPNINKDLII